MGPTESLATQVKLAALVAGFNSTHVEPMLHALVSRLRFYPVLPGEVGVLDQAYPYGHLYRYGVAEGNTAAVQFARFDNALRSAEAVRCGFAFVPDDFEIVINDFLKMPNYTRVVGIGRFASIRNDGTQGDESRDSVFQVGNYFGQWMDRGGIGGVGKRLTYDTLQAVAAGDDEILFSGAPVRAYAPGDVVYIRTNEEFDIFTIPIPLCARFAEVKDVLMAGPAVIGLRLRTPVNQAFTNPRICPANGQFAGDTATDPKGQVLYMVRDCSLENLNMESVYAPMTNGGGLRFAMRDCRSRARFGPFLNMMQDSIIEDVECEFWNELIELSMNSNYTLVRNLKGRAIRMQGGGGPFVGQLKGIGLSEWPHHLTFDNVEVDLRCVNCENNPINFGFQLDGSYNTFRNIKLLVDDFGAGSGTGFIMTCADTTPLAVANTGVGTTTNNTIDGLQIIGQIGRPLTWQHQQGTSGSLDPVFVGGNTLRNVDLNCLPTADSFAVLCDVDLPILCAGWRVRHGSVRIGASAIRHGGFVVDDGELTIGASFDGNKTSEEALKGPIAEVMHLRTLKAFRALSYMIENVQSLGPVDNDQPFQTLDLKDGDRVIVVDGDRLQVDVTASTAGPAANKSIAIVMVHGAASAPTELQLFELQDVSEPKFQVQAEFRFRRGTYTASIRGHRWNGTEQAVAVVESTNVLGAFLLDDPANEVLRIEFRANAGVGTGQQIDIQSFCSRGTRYGFNV